MNGPGMTDGALKDVAQNFVRNQLAGVPGASIPQPFGGPWRQIQAIRRPVQDRSARQMSPMDVVRAMNQANLIMPAGDVQIGNLDYDIYSNAQFNLKEASQYPVKMNGENPVLMSDIGELKDAHALQYNVVHVERAALSLSSGPQTGRQLKHHHCCRQVFVTRCTTSSMCPRRCAPRWFSISPALCAPPSKPCCMKAASGCSSPA